MVNSSIIIVHSLLDNYTYRQASVFGICDSEALCISLDILGIHIDALVHSLKYTIDSRSIASIHMHLLGLDGNVEVSIYQGVMGLGAINLNNHKCITSISYIMCILEGNIAVDNVSGIFVCH